MARSEALPALDDILGVFANSLAQFGAFLFRHDRSLPVQWHQQGCLFGRVSVGGVIGLPFADNHETQKHCVDDTGGEEQRNQDVVVTLGDMPADKFANDSRADDGIENKSAHEQNRFNDPFHCRRSPLVTVQRKMLLIALKPPLKARIGYVLRGYGSIRRAFAQAVLFVNQYTPHGQSSRSGANRVGSIDGL
jgi:hypothetical protein